MATNPFHYSPDNDPGTGSTQASNITQIGGVAVDTNAGAAGAGTLRVIAASNDPVVTQLVAGATAVAKAEDAASANGDVGVPAMAIQVATPADTAGTDGDYTFIQMKNGRVWTSSNITLGGVALDGNSGVKSAQTLRVVLATDQPALTNPLLTSIQLGATAVDGNSGNKSAGTVRVVLATDQPSLTNALLVNGSKTPADAVTTPTDAQNVESFPLAFNNSTSDRLRNSSAANIVRSVQPDSLIATAPGLWSISTIVDSPTVASVSKAAGGAGIRHVAAIAIAEIYTAAATFAGTGYAFRVRDGATGAGTVLLLGLVNINTLTASGQNIDKFITPEMRLPGTANTAMTIEFSATATNLSQLVTLLGWSTQ